MNDPQKKHRLGTVSKNILLEGLNHFHDANLTLDYDVDQDTFGKVTFLALKPSGVIFYHL